MKTLNIFQAIWCIMLVKRFLILNFIYIEKANLMLIDKKNVFIFVDLSHLIFLWTWNFLGNIIKMVSENHIFETYRFWFITVDINTNNNKTVSHYNQFRSPIHYPTFEWSIKLNHFFIAVVNELQILFIFLIMIMIDI